MSGGTGKPGGYREGSMSRPFCSSSSRLVCSSLLLAVGALAAWTHFGSPVVGEHLSSAAMVLSPARSPARQADDLYHWPRLPVRVFIAADSKQEKQWARTATAGFDEWVRATRGIVSYTQVYAAPDAQITVRFVPAPTVPGHPGLVGLTTTFWLNQVLQEAEIVLATGGKTPGDLQTAAAHELGHALGISGHSSDPDDLMFPAPIRHGHWDGGTNAASAHPVTGRDLAILERCYPTLFAATSASDGKNSPVPYQTRPAATDDKAQ